MKNGFISKSQIQHPLASLPPLNHVPRNSAEQKRHRVREMDKIPCDDMPKTYEWLYIGFRVFDGRALGELEGTLMVTLLVYFSLALPNFPIFPTFLVSEKSSRFA